MASNIDIVKRLNKAGEAKDFKTLESLLHPNYTCKDPLMEFNSAQEFIQFMKDNPSDCTLQNVEFIEQGNKVVQTLDAVIKTPVEFSFRMCDIVTIEDGKVKSEEVFYDTAEIPESAREKIEEAAKGKKAA